MATVKIKFRASTIQTKEGTVFYQVIHNRVVRQVYPGYKLYPHEWDTAHATVVLPPGTESSRQQYLLSLRDALADDVRRIEAIIVRFERTARTYTAEEVAECFRVLPETGGFIPFGRDLIRKLEQIGKIRTAERYTTVMNSFGRFLGERDVLLDEIDSGLMVEYELFLQANRVCPNSSSYYMRGLRAIYNRAVEMELTMQRSPFRYVYTGIDKTVKRAVPLKIIRRIMELDLVRYPALDFARDIFMFSFYTRGMSFVDMAYLKKQDLQNGILSYRRQKTGQMLLIKWERPMQEIVDKYDTGASPYLLPIIKSWTADGWRQYKNAAHLVNGKLKHLGAKLGLSIPLTTYVARHAWASIAKSKNVPLGTICEAMGHDSEKTTRIYLASLDTSAVDKANSQILKYLRTAKG